jgi:WD40 repeat protein
MMNMYSHLQFTLYIHFICVFVCCFSFSRVNTKLDYATACAFSHDSKYIVIALNETKKIHIYGINYKNQKAELTALHSFPTPHKDPITSLCFSPNHSFICTLSSGQDTSIHLFSPKGNFSGIEEVVC